MIDFDFNIRLRIGSDYSDSTEKKSLFKRMFSWVIDSYYYILDYIDFLSEDTEENMRITYDEGYDAYMILYGKDFPSGYYANSANKSEWFYKSFSEDGNTIAAFVMPLVYVENAVHRMDGVQMTPTNSLLSKSLAETYITNCDEANIDPYIELRISYLPNGVGIVWYGRHSKFEPVIVENSTPDINYQMEMDSISEWLIMNPDEDPDPIDLMAIQRIREMENAVNKSRQRKRRNVYRARN